MSRCSCPSRYFHHEACPYYVRPAQPDGEAWRRPFPDATTEAIDRIDAELASTQTQRERLAREALCLTCGERGIHAHYRAAQVAPSRVPGGES